MASASTLTTLATLLLLITSLAASSPSTEFGRSLFSLTPKTHLIITNSLQGREKLTIRCWSDDNLGFHVIDVGGKYEVVFYPDIFWTTRFVCELTWARGFIHFDAYRAGRDRKRCGKVCEWVATMGSVAGGAGDIVYPWQDPYAPPAIWEMGHNSLIPEFPCALLENFGAKHN